MVTFMLNFKPFFEQVRYENSGTLILAWFIHLQ